MATVRMAMNVSTFTSKKIPNYHSVKTTTQDFAKEVRDVQRDTFEGKSVNSTWQDSVQMVKNVDMVFISKLVHLQNQKNKKEDQDKTTSIEMIMIRKISVVEAVKVVDGEKGNVAITRRSDAIHVSSFADIHDLRLNAAKS